ncbi:ribosome biogenesis GTPase Der [Pontibacter sp. G13]|uniref:ribosome biogenesis GTPase Der n=1 Tax=Pontibacter sp. G13 TaxID=3074898 RepID=UPI00288C5B2F|nr:ribosome biogenesis GTPase Der [Pontibacter sp. G13]WNJ18872.1 ribosome biogenesis GTPase Der [Pontibacter sp. G13]
MSGIVAIVGRPNVGKSTLFNRLVESRQAIVDDMSGVTRDRNYGTSEWNGKEFSVIDTGGYVPKSDDVFEAAIREQVHIAMEEADVLIFLVDVQAGVTPLDKSFANIIRRSPKKVIMAANKVDGNNQRDDLFEFYELGLGDLMPISAINGAGTGELMDTIVEMLPEDKPVEDTSGVPKFAIVGRPNVGKSSMVNALLGREANIVTPIAGTTRDSVDTRFKAFDRDLILVDTAGLRKKAKVHENIEFYSTLRSVKAIESCDVGILIIDATLGIEAQDLNILGMLQKHRKGVVILVNKWDLLKKETNTARDFKEAIIKRIAPFTDVPIIFTSAVTKQRLLKGLEAAKQVYDNMTKKVSTSELNEVMLAAIARHHAPSHRGHIIRIKYVTQIPAKVPTFLFFTNHPNHIKESYKRYLENKLREHFDFTGAPLNLFFRKK